MKQDKQEEKLIYVGYDLTDQWVSISYSGNLKSNPVSIGSVVGGNKTSIPLVLCKWYGMEQWCYGEEAKRVAQAGDGCLVDELLHKCLAGQQILIEDNVYEPVDLLKLFIKKTLHLLSFHCDKDYRYILVISCRKLNNEILQILKQIIHDLQIDSDKVYFQSHGESFFSYMIHQEKPFIRQQSLLFEINHREITAYYLAFQYNTRPYTAITEEFSEIIDTEEKDLPFKEGENIDDMMLSFTKKLTADYSAASVFLIGEGSVLDTLSATKEYLCRYYRVFQGINLFSKGACFGAIEKDKKEASEYQYLYLGKDMVRENIGILTLNEKEEEYFTVINAGVNWYDAVFEGDFILDKAGSIILYRKPIYPGEVKRHEILLEGIPARPPKTTRIHLSAYFNRKNKFILEIRDLGFGEIFISSGKKWIFKMDME